jgi:hypothetical protein
VTKSGFQGAVLSANVAILALSALAIGKWMGMPAAVAALVGNLLGVLNLLGLTWLVGKLLGTAERGGTNKGVYAAILAFKLGAFVGVMPNQDGLLHISEIAHERVNVVTDFLKEGDEVEVKVIWDNSMGFDDKNKLQTYLRVTNIIFIIST